MSGPSRLQRVLALATLRRSRALLRARFGRLLAVTIGVVYALVAMITGLMLVFGREPASEVIIVTSGPQWWNYPGLLIIAPNAVLSLPFFATLTMIVVSVGVGIGMAVAVLLGVRLVRLRRAGAGRTTAYGTAAGLTPAMIALLTLGACCSTTAAATAGIGVAAQAGGTNLQSVLANSWYLGVFQMAVLWVALIAQEELLTVYSALFDPGSDTAAPLAPAPIDLRYVGSGALRLALLLGGVTWSLAMFAEWTTMSPSTAPWASWLSWALEHQSVAVFAVGVALFPDSTLGALARAARRAGGRAARVALGVGGGSLLVLWPPSIAAAGWFGLPNEVLGWLGGPSAWGGLSPPVGGLALALRWGFQFGLLGAFTLIAAAFPERLAATLLGAPGSALGEAVARPSATPATAPILGASGRVEEP